jgi:RNA polymerase sigma-70 factor (ECF subfamily)
MQTPKMIEAITPDKIMRAQRGDASVISELYERNRQSIFRYLYYRVGDLQTAEDLTADVFVRMLHALNGYQPRNVSFEAWLFQIARNLAIDHHRKMSLRKHVSLEDAQGQAGPALQAHDLPFDSQSLQHALEQLNETQRDVIILRFINQVPLAQVAGALHKSEDAIKALQRRGLAALRQILDGLEIQND